MRLMRIRLGAGVLSVAVAATSYADLLPPMNRPLEEVGEPIPHPDPLLPSGEPANLLFDTTVRYDESMRSHKRARSASNSASSPEIHHDLSSKGVIDYLNARVVANGSIPVYAERRELFIRLDHLRFLYQELERAKEANALRRIGLAIDGGFVNIVRMDASKTLHPYPRNMLLLVVTHEDTPYKVEESAEIVKSLLRLAVHSATSQQNARVLVSSLDPRFGDPTNWLPLLQSPRSTGGESILVCYAPALSALGFDPRGLSLESLVPTANRLPHITAPAPANGAEAEDEVMSEQFRTFLQRAHK